jgi:hypothetical protein
LEVPEKHQYFGSSLKELGLKHYPWKVPLDKKSRQAKKSNEQKRSSSANIFHKHSVSMVFYEMQRLPVSAQKQSCTP